MLQTAYDNPRQGPTLRVVEPFPDVEIASLWNWMQGFRGRVCDDLAPATFPEFLEFYLSQVPAMRTFGVSLQRNNDPTDLEFGGFVSVTQLTPYVAETHLVFSRRFWGHETTVPALRAIYSHVFAETPRLMTITASVFEDNHQLIQLAKAVGAVEETSPKHPLRNRTMRGGKPIGLRVVSLFREEFE